MRWFMSGYVELQARSAFSFLEGASLPEELIEVCAHQGSGAMALLDGDGVYGAARFHLAAKKLKVKAHIGSEIDCRVFGSSSWDTKIPLLVSSRAGYQNLCRLITQMKLRVPKNTPAFTCPEELAQYSGGLICLTGGEDVPLVHALQNGGTTEARHVLQQLASVFGPNNLFIELQRHYDRAEEARNQAA